MAVTSFLDLNRYLRLMVEQNASDAFFIPGSPVRLKVEGRMVSVGETKITGEMMKAAVNQIMDDDQRRVFGRDRELDFAVGVSGVAARFRINAYYQLGKVAFVARYVRNQLPTLEELNMPPILQELILRRYGLLLVAGPTGCGKSTTIAAMLNYRNEHQSGHILTVEDPIEFVHPHKKSLFSQRALGRDTHSYTQALRSAMREAPDVVMIGEIRDQETLQAVLELASTGHLIVSTLHAKNTYQAVQRLQTLVPSELQQKLFMDLSISLVGLISQRLVPDQQNRQQAVIEIMINNAHVSDLLLQGKITDLKEAVRDSGTKGMQTFEQHLLKLYKDKHISLETALENADSRSDMEARMDFGGL